MNTTTLHALNVVRTALARYTDAAPDQMQPDTKLADIQIDSLTQAELLFELEDQLNVRMAEPPAPPQTIADLIALVEPYIATQAMQSAA